MQRSDSNQNLSAHRQVRSSTTLNRRYVKRPINGVAQNPIKSAVPQDINSVVRVRMQSRTKVAPKVARPTAVELKEQAIRKALAEANRLPSVQEESQPKMAEAIKKTDQPEKVKKSSGLKASKIRFGIGRVLLALGCAVAAVFAIVYLVNATMPDVSLKVAAMQAGIDSPYPSYIPRGYSITDATSESNKITLTFKNSGTNGAFTLTEERSSWDSAALLSNFVKDAYGENYTVVREQGLTIYINNSNATWVNGGVVYKIKTTSGALTKKQIQSIAVSL